MSAVEQWPAVRGYQEAPSVTASGSRHVFNHPSAVQNGDLGHPCLRCCPKQSSSLTTDPLNASAPDDAGAKRDCRLRHNFNGERETSRRAAETFLLLAAGALPHSAALRFHQLARLTAAAALRAAAAVSAGAPACFAANPHIGDLVTTTPNWRARGERSSPVQLCKTGPGIVCRGFEDQLLADRLVVGIALIDPTSEVPCIRTKWPACGRQVCFQVADLRSAGLFAGVSLQYSAMDRRCGPESTKKQLPRSPMTFVTFHTKTSTFKDFKFSKCRKLEAITSQTSSVASVAGHACKVLFRALQLSHEQFFMRGVCGPRGPPT